MILELARTVRAGGGGRTERSFLDFVVDGELLGKQVKQDLVTPLGWGASDEQAKSIERLMRRSRPDLPSGRISLYVCPESGDLGCGAVGAYIEHANGALVWREFAFEAPGAEPSELTTLGPFVFDREAYMDVLERQRVHLGSRGA
jgi:hypothetical protein